MSLTEQDIHLMESELMLDTDDGGGAMAGKSIVDGESNNMLPPPSQLNRTVGSVHLRKAFVAVLSADDEPFYGVNAIIDRVPVDPAVSVVLFSTKDWFDVRTDAISRMESYLARGALFEGYLWERHISGSKALRVLQNPDADLPNVGQTLVLVAFPGEPNEASQYVRLTSVASEPRTFYAAGCDPDGFVLNVLTLEISDPLTLDFDGGAPNCDFASGAGDLHRIYETVVADAAKYAGMKPLDDAATTGDYTIKVADIFEQLVPSAQIETPIANAKPSGDLLTQAGAGGEVTVSVSSGWTPTVNLLLGQSFLRGSLTIETSGYTIVDEGDTRLTLDGVQIGTVDYDNAILKLNGDSYSFNGTKVVKFIPAASPLRNAQTYGHEVTIEGRSGTHVFVLDPVPAPNTLRVSYMAQGRWYTLYEDGAGALVGQDTSYGTGSVNFTTGDVIVTFGALPDVGSTILAVWSTALIENDRSGGVIKATHKLTLGGTDVLTKGSVVLTWVDNDLNPQTATDDGQGGFTGDATGTIDYATREVAFAPNTLPPANAEITIAASTENGATPETGIATVDANGVTLSVQAVPGSVRLSCQTEHEDILMYDDGNGKLFAVDVARNGVSRLEPPVQEIGTVDYVSGACVQTVPITYKLKERVYVGMGQSRVAFVDKTGLVVTWVFTTASYVSGGTSSALPAEVVTFAPALYLTPNFSETVVTGSVRIRWQNASSDYLDLGAGRLVGDFDHADGTSVELGNINYATGDIALLNYEVGAVNSGTVLALLTTFAQLETSQVVFRTPSAPIRPGSLILQFQFFDDNELTTATYRADGTVDHPFVIGSIDHQTGVVSAQFGTLVADSAHAQAQSWYDPQNVVDGMVLEPKPVLADTVRFAAVSYTYIPLDKDVVGIDPVRLPSDGRVPIFRSGDVVVVHHEDSLIIPTPTNGLTFDCGRVRLSRVWLFDEGNNDARVATDKFTVDLDAGTGQLVDVSGILGTIRVEHRIEDMKLVAEAQINGNLTLSQPITHDYPALDTGVSSTLIIGDLQSRMGRPFDQKVWTNEWSDTLIGDPTTAEYNDTQYPITTTNQGAIQEDWALIFINNSEVRVVGKNTGQIAILSIAEDIAPINPATNAPYFFIDKRGWGSGWVTGNVLRISSYAANYPIQVARTTQQSIATEDSDSFRIQIRGDSDV